MSLTTFIVIVLLAPTIAAAQTNWGPAITFEAESSAGSTTSANCKAHGGSVITRTDYDRLSLPAPPRFAILQHKRSGERVLAVLFGEDATGWFEGLFSITRSHYLKTCAWPSP
jgi:hypothetical protein